MQPTDLHAQALALKETAETMVKAGYLAAADATTRKAAEALVQAAQQLRGDNPVIAALTVPDALMWPEVLTIANAVYRS